LADVCKRITGQSKYTCEFIDATNIGRLAVLKYGDSIAYVSFSELVIRSRNASFQSFPSALSRCILDKNDNSKIYYYFLPETEGNFETTYFMFMYRLMKTAGVNFLNLDEYVQQPILSFSSPDDIIASKDAMRSANPGNKSTYLTRGEKSQIQIYGKTYGAGKYETTLICVAISNIATSKVELFEIEEGGLKALPKTSKDAIDALGVIKIFRSNKEIENAAFIQNDSIRSPRYIYNLLEKWGDKKCAFCDCEIPQIIQGAHIWPVAEIKREDGLNHDEKVSRATDGENGLWLCENHHKLFDTGILALSENGEILHLAQLNDTNTEFLMKITTNTSIAADSITEEMLGFLANRNLEISSADYVNVV